MSSVFDNMINYWLSEYKWHLLNAFEDIYVGKNCLNL